MKKLKYKLWIEKREDSTLPWSVYFQVTEQEEIERYSEFKDNGFLPICSFICPGIYEDKIFIRGTYADNDKIIASISFKTRDLARKYMALAKKSLENFKKHHGIIDDKSIKETRFKWETQILKKRGGGYTLYLTTEGLPKTGVNEIAGNGIVVIDGIDTTFELNGGFDVSTVRVSVNGRGVHKEYFPSKTRANKAKKGIDCALAEVFGGRKVKKAPVFSFEVKTVGFKSGITAVLVEINNKKNFRGIGEVNFKGSNGFVVNTWHGSVRLEDNRVLFHCEPFHATATHKMFTVKS